MLEQPAIRTIDRARAAGGTLPFFAAALGITWLLQLPALLAQKGVIPGPVERYLVLAVLGGFGPCIAAVLMARIEAGRAGVRALFRRMRIWRISPVWYCVALGLFAAIYVAGSAVYRLFGGDDAGRWLYPPEHAQHVSAMIIIPFAEEPGWRGFALPRLQERYAPLRASLVLGIFWAAWHTMMFVLQGATPLIFVIAILNIVAGSIVFSWIFNRTRESLLFAILAHVGVHLNNPFHALPDNITPFVVYTVAVAVFAGAIVLIDRPAWRAHQPQLTAL
jgi:membrane protease YdiL (CAAX protease family)